MNDYKAKIEAIQIKAQEAVSLTNFKFWQEKSITKSQMDVKLYEVEQEATASLLQLLQEARIEELEPYTDLQLDPAFDSDHFNPCSVCGEPSHRCLCDQAIMWVERKASKRIAELKGEK